jgi:hypothetical protein
VSVRTDNEVVIYHDSTAFSVGEKLSGHVFFVVPEVLKYSKEGSLFEEDVILDVRELIYKRIKEIRSEYKLYGKLHFSEISGNKWGGYDIGYRAAVDLSVDALRNRLITMDYPYMCKLAVIIYSSPGKLKSYGGDFRREKVLRYDETLMRFLVRGGMHYLYDEDNKVKLKEIISDGEPYHRELDSERIIGRLLIDDYFGDKPLRSYLSMSPDIRITHLPSNHKEHEVDSANYVSANILQLSDLILGSIKYICYEGVTCGHKLPCLGAKVGVKNKKAIIAYPVKTMLDKIKRGYSFRNSSHFKSFTITKAFLENGEWKFENITSKQPITKGKKAVNTLF